MIIWKQATVIKNCGSYNYNLLDGRYNTE